MDIREYIFRNKLMKYEFAEMIGVSPSALNVYITRRVTPSLETALHINKVTKGEIALTDMIAIRGEGAHVPRKRRARNESKFVKRKSSQDSQD